MDYGNTPGSSSGQGAELQQGRHSSQSIDDWNNPPQEVIDATSVNISTNRLDKYWKDMGIYS